MMKANKKVMAALLAAMMTVSAGAAVVSADTAVSGPGSSITNPITGKGWYAKDITLADGTTKTYYYYSAKEGTWTGGWKVIDGKWYYFGELNTTTGKIEGNSDSKEIKNETYAGAPRYAIVNDTVNIKCADGKTYSFRFGADGTMVTGWCKVDASNGVDPVVGTAGNWEYYNTNGARQFGWIKDGANWFYIATADTDCAKVNWNGTLSPVTKGTMLADGTYQINGVNYTFASNGVLVNQGQGWVKDGDNWYWVQQDGSKFAGVAEVKDGTGYIYASKSWNKINGKYYLFEDSGKMLTGWQRAFTDANKTDNKWYYMTANGDCVLNSWIQVNGNWYLTNASGEMVTGWAVRGGKTYFLGTGKENGLGLGVMATGTITMNGSNYTFDANGALVSVNGQNVNPGVIPQ